MYHRAQWFKKQEGEKHYNAKIKLGGIFQSKFGYDVYYEVLSRERIQTMGVDPGVKGQLSITTLTQQFDYQFDVFLRLGTYKNYDDKGFVVVEVDGKVGHTSPKADIKDHRRDTHIYEKYGIPTVRFNPKDIVGAKALNLQEIISEYQYQIEGFEDNYKPYYCFTCKKFWYDREVCCGGGRRTYKRKMLAVQRENKWDDCTWCGHPFAEHSVSGCNHVMDPQTGAWCEKCITGIIHTTAKRNG